MILSGMTLPSNPRLSQPNRLAKSPLMAQEPSTRVLPHELPASLREAGLDNWIREPLDDAVDRRRRIIMPPAAAVLGTPARGHQRALLAETRHPDTLFM